MTCTTEKYSRLHADVRSPYGYRIYLRLFRQSHATVGGEPHLSLFWACSLESKLLFAIFSLTLERFWHSALRL